MGRKSFEINEKGSSFIRLPQNLEDEGLLLLKLSKSMAGKTIKIQLLDSDSYEIPFDDDVIWDNSPEEAVIDYYGSDEYWRPEFASYECVDGYPNCSFEECCAGNCHNVTCPIWQGLEELYPLWRIYLRSSREDNE